MSKLVLGGQIIEELSSSGEKNAGYVYAGRQLLATQTPNYPTNMVMWKHQTPVGTGEYTTNTYIPAIGRTEFDPLGADLALTAPEEPPPDEGNGDVGAGHFGGLMDARWADFFNLSSGCTIDFKRTMCSEAMLWINTGAGEQCPNNECVRTTVVKGALRPNVFHIGADGYRGYELGGSSEGQNGSMPDSYVVNLAGTQDSGMTIIEGEGFADTDTGFLQNPQNPFPGFDTGKLADVNKALTKGAELLKDSNCQKALAKAGINVSDLLKAFGNLKARPATDPSSQGYNIYYGEKSTEPKAQAFMLTDRGKGAGAFIMGQSIMVRGAFFNARGGARIDGEISRALALIHEAIHIGPTGKGDLFFKGSSKLNDIIIHGCWNKLYGHDDLATVGN